jgi:hypothetical protein
MTWGKAPTTGHANGPFRGLMRVHRMEHTSQRTVSPTVATRASWPEMVAIVYILIWNQQSEQSRTWCPAQAMCSCEPECGRV